MSTRWRVAIVAVAVAIAAAAVAVVLLDDDDDERSATTTSTEMSTSTSSSTTDDGATTGPGTSSSSSSTATTSTTTAEPVLDDGRHPAFLTGLDVAGRTLELDLIQLLTGDEAIAAYQEDHPDDPGGPPNDYYIVNDNPRLRTLPIAEDVEVTVVEGSQSVPFAFADLPDRLAGDLEPDDDRIWYNPFWLTVEDGTVTAIEEQYLP